MESLEYDVAPVTNVEELKQQIIKSAEQIENTLITEVVKVSWEKESLSI